LTQVQQPYSLSPQSCSCQASPRSYGAQECSCIFCIPNDQRIVGGMRRSSRVSKPTRRSLEAKESEQDYHNHQLEAEQEKRTIHESLHNSAQRAKRRSEDSTERKKQVSAFAESRKQYYTPKELLALSAEDATFPGAIPLGHIDKIITVSVRCVITLFCMLTTSLITRYPVFHLLSLPDFCPLMAL
jgi:hypothetical protein